MLGTNNIIAIISLLSLSFYLSVAYYQVRFKTKYCYAHAFLITAYSTSRIHLSSHYSYTSRTIQDNRNIIEFVIVEKLFYLFKDYGFIHEFLQYFFCQNMKYGRFLAVLCCAVLCYAMLYSVPRCALLYVI
jgi:hypothetical protein